MTGPLDVQSTITSDGLEVAGNVSVDGGTIKLDGNYPAGTRNVALGDTALDSLDASSPGGDNVAIGANALTANTTASYNTAVGAYALSANTAGVWNTATGREALSANTGSYNTAFGAQALISNTTASNNTAVGYYALQSNTAANNVALGYGSAYQNTSGTSNTALGYYALQSNTTASNNTAVGYQAGYYSTTGSPNTFVGYQAGYSNSTGSNLTALGSSALYSNTTGQLNAGTSQNALYSNTTGGSNTATGVNSMYSNTTGSNNVGLGKDALRNNTTGIDNTAVGYQAGYSNTTNSYNTYLGDSAGYATTSTRNTFLGHASGESMTTGERNTILGRFSGNYGGLDIRTLSNNIVLSDGDGNPRMWVNDNGYSNFSNTTSWQSGGIAVHSFEQSDGTQDVLHLRHPAVSGGYGLFVKLDGNPNNTTNYFIQASDTTAAKFKVYSNGNVVNTNNSYGSISDVKLKENIVDSGSQWDDIKALTVRKYSMKADNLDAPNMLGVIAQEVETAGMGGLVITSPDLDPETKEDLGTVTKQVNYSILYMKAVKALQEAMDRIETLEAKVTALENA